MIGIDVVIPVYHSEANMVNLVDSLASWTLTTQLKPTFIFVNDGSIDKTGNELLKALKQSSISYKFITLAQNYGQHTATAIGFYYCTNNLIATIDDDLQHDPSVIDSMYNCMINDNCDLVYGNYTQKKHNSIRNIGTRTLQKILQTGGRDYSMVTSCRLIKKSVITVFKKQQNKIFFIDDYLLLGAQKVKSCIVEHRARAIGKSGYTIFKLIKMAISILLLHSTLPLKIISRLGLWMSIAFFVMGCYYIYKKLAFDAEIGFTSLIVAIFFSTGLILFSLGIIGEYIRRIWVSKQLLDHVIIAELCEN